MVVSKRLHDICMVGNQLQYAYNLCLGSPCVLESMRIVTITPQQDIIDVGHSLANSAVDEGSKVMAKVMRAASPARWRPLEGVLNFAGKLII